MIKITLIKILRFLTESLINFTNYLNKGAITMSTPIYDDKGRFLLYIVDNNRLLDNYEVLKLIYSQLQGDNTFKEFGSKKIIYMSCIINNQILPFHHNVLITNTITFEEYWNSIKDSISRHYSYDITENGGIPRFEIKIWSIDNYLNRNIKGNPNTYNREDFYKFKRTSIQNTLKHSRFYSSSTIRGENTLFRTSEYKELVKPETKPSIKPLKQKKFYDVKDANLFSTLDIETISLKMFDNFQIPVIITS
jgi:hypothetical protein